ncbi:MAG TPA: riboflavin biosynthesis protein RibF, partial [Elusimicrobiales bacterium]|nr:riboflavin biosynthesis protein RibF [Elusimicrobiales bacterium]
MPCYLTIGTYDGVHLGHRKLIRALLRESLRSGMPSSLLYFPEPPKCLFSGETANFLITLPEEREALIRGLGVERVARFPFRSRLAGMSAESFFRSVIIGKQRAGGLCVGHDFAVGKGRLGNVEFLRRRCAESGLRFKTTPFASMGGHKISSSLIRTLLRAGHVEEAGARLGRNYSVSGPVVRGAGIGRGLGFPTANIGAHPAKILPPGVFAVRARLEKGVVLCGVANVGRRPTVEGSDGRPLLEAHLFGCARDLYGLRLEVEFLKHLRSERRFGSREAL